MAMPNTRVTPTQSRLNISFEHSQKMQKNKGKKKNYPHFFNLAAPLRDFNVYGQQVNNVKCSPITVANSGDGKRLVQITAQLQVLTPLLSATSSAITCFLV